MNKSLLLACLLFSFSAYSFIYHPSRPADQLSFSKSKTILKQIYKAEPSTFYCGCDIEWKTKKKLIPNSKSCGYQPRNKYTKKGKLNVRATRIEWEHVVPAWEFGHQLSCWQKGGRKACKKTKGFKRIEADLHNLVPAIGEINADRSNYKYQMISGEQRVYGQCDAEVNFKSKAFEPAEDIRGNIARTYFYFEKEYSLKLSKKQRQLYTAWDAQDPVDVAECRIQSLKEKKQGHPNPFIKSQCSTFKI